MRKLSIVFITFLFCYVAFGSESQVSEVENKLLDCNYPLKMFIKANCEGQCLKIPENFNESCHYSEIIDEEIDDPTKPVYSKNEVEACLDQADCEAKNATKTCIDSEESALMAQDYSEIYCSKLLRFEKKLSGAKVLVENASMKATYEAAKAAKDAKDAAIKMAKKAIDCGKQVIAMLVVQNASKGLDTTQIKAMNATYSTIKDLLETGSLTSAREEILAATADGVLVTDTDKTVLVAELDSCKP